jgi:flavin-binding protein dodecin
LYNQTPNFILKGEKMAKVVKVIEVMSQSDKSWEDAAQNAIDEASKSIRNIKSIWIKDKSAKVTDGKISKYRITAKISFVID